MGDICLGDRSGILCGGGGGGGGGGDGGGGGAGGGDVISARDTAVYGSVGTEGIQDGLAEYAYRVGVGFQSDDRVYTEPFQPFSAGYNPFPDFSMVSQATSGPSNPGVGCPAVPVHPKGADIDANIRATEAAYNADPIGIGAQSWWIDQVKSTGAWDYKLQTPDQLTYDAFGNFNYGATGCCLQLLLLYTYKRRSFCEVAKKSA